MKTLFVIAIFAAMLSGCATPYQSSGITGGFSDEHVAEDVYRVRFSGNGHVTRETAQTYWLYRSAELTIEKGFDSFEILSPIALGSGEAKSPYVNALFLFIPMPNDSRKPYIEADIRLLKGPVDQGPPKVFNALALRAELEQYVKSEKKCSMGNVCPHIKRYLEPAAPKEAAPAASPT